MKAEHNRKCSALKSNDKKLTTKKPRVFLLVYLYINLRRYICTVLPNNLLLRIKICFIFQI